MKKANTRGTAGATGVVVVYLDAPSCGLGDGFHDEHLLRPLLERRLEKTILRAPADGVVSVIVAEVGENVRAGQPVLAIEETGNRSGYLSVGAG